MKAIYDESGVTWHVMAHDPASQIVNKLRREGFDLVVLPRYTLMTGKIPPAVPDCTDFIRSVRLEDCLTVIGGD